MTEMDPFRLLNILFLYLSQFTIVQNVIICTCLSATASVFAGNVLLVIVYIVGMYLSFCIASHLVGKREHLHCELVLLLIDGILIGKSLLRKTRKLCTRVATATHKRLENGSGARMEALSWEEIVQYSVPHAEAEKMIHCIMKDFVHTWYSQISSSEVFSDEVQGALEVAVNNIFLRLQTVRKYKFTEWCIHSFRHHLIMYQKAVNKLKQQPRYKQKRSDSAVEFTKLKNVTEAFVSLGYAHATLKDNETEFTHFLSLIRAFLVVLLPDSAVQCEPVIEALSQIITRNILIHLVNMMSDPHWVHKTLIRILSDEELIWIDRTVQQKSDANYGRSNTTEESLLKTHLMLSKENGNICQEEGGQRKSSDAYHAGSVTVKFCNESHLETALREEKASVLKCHDLSGDCSDGTDSAVAGQSTKFILGAPDNDTPFLGSGEDSYMQGMHLEGRFSPEGESISTSSADSEPQTAMPLHSEPFNVVYPTVGTVNAVDVASAINSCNIEQRLFQTVLCEDDLDSDDDSIGETEPLQYMLEEDSVAPTEKQFSEAAEARMRHLHSPTHLFEEITINETETAKESGGHQYTLYSIQYKSWHRNEVGTWTLRQCKVKRRYREFVTLQDRLDEHPLYKKSMRGVWGPQRWTVLPLGNMRESNVEKRRTALTNYLQVLIGKEDVGNSMALREFLAYEGDGGIAFVRKAPEMPRIDKAVLQTFSGLVSKISSALPSLSSGGSEGLTQQQGSSHHQLDATSQDLAMWTDEHALSIDCSSLGVERTEGAASLEHLLNRHLHMVVPSGDSCVHLLDAADGEEYHDVSDSVPLITDARSDGDGCDSGELKLGTKDSNIPLAAAILDLAATAVDGNNTYVKQEKVISLVKVTLGRAINKLLEREVADLTTQKHCTYLVYLLRETIWPDGVLDSEPTSAPSQQQIDVTREQAKQCFKDFLPGFLPYLVGKQVYDNVIDEVFASVEHSFLNRHLILCLLNQLLLLLIPELMTLQLQQKLLCTHQH